jgi:hypothetical protein
MTTRREESNESSDSKRDKAAFPESIAQLLSSGAALWFVFLLCGGVVFAVYYARIGYLPDIELNSALSYVAAASMIGASLIALLTLLIVVPGYIWTTQLTHREPLSALFCEGKHISYKFLQNLILWLFLSATLMHLILILHYRSLFLLLLLIALTKELIIWFLEIKKDCHQKGSKARELFIAYSFWYAVSMGSVLVAIYILFKFLDLSQAVWVKTHFVICTLGVVIANSVVTVFLHQKRWLWACALALFFALGLVVATDYFDHVPNRILGNYGFGTDHVQIVVNNEGYKTLKSQGLVAGDDSNVDAKAISDVSILCRMGENYFLKINNRKVTLRKSNVLSWSVEEKH